MAITSALIMAGSSILSSGFGLLQSAQARRLERENRRPQYQLDPSLQNNLALAQQQRRVGLPSQVYNNQLGLIQQSFATGLRTLNQRGNTSYNVNSMLRNANQSVGNLNAMDAQARQQGTQQVMNANSAIAQDRRYQFNVNQMQPYQQNAQNIAGMRRAGIQNTFGGLGMLAQGAMMGVFDNGVNPNVLSGAKSVGASIPSTSFSLPRGLGGV